MMTLGHEQSLGTEQNDGFFRSWSAAIARKEKQIADHMEALADKNGNHNQHGFSIFSFSDNYLAIYAEDVLPQLGDGSVTLYHYPEEVRPRLQYAVGVSTRDILVADMLHMDIPLRRKTDPGIFRLWPSQADYFFDTDGHYKKIKLFKSSKSQTELDDIGIFEEGSRRLPVPMQLNDFVNIQHAISSIAFRMGISLSE